MRRLIIVAALLLLSFQTVQASPPVLFGAYYHPNEITELRGWLEFMGSDVSVSIGGDFVGLPPSPWHSTRLAQYGSMAGVVPFVNIMPQDCALQEISLGACDREIDALIAVYKGYNGRVFLAPFPEANGGWVEYGLQPTAYKAAYKYLRNRFIAAGLGRDRILWVFAPNGWSSSGHEFERYYPGDDVVDIVGFSAFNHGQKCGAAYLSYEQAVLPYLIRMSALAPDKPIFLTQFGSLENKGAWTADVLTKFAKFPGARAAIYFNTITDECGGRADYTITGLPEIVPALSGYGFWPASSPSWEIAFQDAPQTFGDVVSLHPFTGRDYVEQIYKDGITGGCSAWPMLYCPTKNVTRAEMAVFLLRAKYGGNYQPQAPTGVFTDVPLDYWAAAWIEQLWRDGITGGCWERAYCPEQTVTRAQMAVFILRVKHGADYRPPPAVGLYSDIPGNHWARDWVEQIGVEGVIPGCAPTWYCPDNTVTRDYMAEYLAKIKD